MTPLQVAPIATLRASPGNLQDVEPGYPSKKEMTASHRPHNSPESASPPPLHPGMRYAPQLNAQENSDPPESPVASSLSVSDALQANATPSDNSQSTVYVETTPPTSSSGPSSQSQHTHLPRSHRSDSASREHTTLTCDSPSTLPVELNDRPFALSIHTTPTSPTVAQFQDQALNHGQKRTASGAAKPSSSSLPTSPSKVAGQGHSRNASLDSGGTEIGELSLQLRTRLSYAMLKVQNGWQSHSLGEVENLASKQASPISNPLVPHGSRRVQQSPVRSMATPKLERGVFSRSPERSVGTGRVQLPWTHENMATNPEAATQLHHSTLNTQISPSSSKTPTYESFWRQHSARLTTQSQPTRPAGPSLEPPANIFSRNSRRTGPQPAQPPALYTKSLSNLSTSSEASAQSFIPATPPPPPQKRATATRTPSQNAAMEKDAVETLLFMSSPVNSGYHPQNGHVPGTPVRTPYRTAGEKRVGFAGATAGLESSDEEPRGLPRHRTSRVSDVGFLDKEDDIDRMLDAMDSSSDDEL